MIDLLYLSYDNYVPASDYFDMTMIMDLLEGRIWQTPYFLKFRAVDSFKEIDADGAVIVFPARRQAAYIDQLNKDLSRLRWAVLFVVGDEAQEFPAHQIKHPNIKLWIMSANPQNHVEGARKIGSGYAPEAKRWLYEYENEAIDKPLPFYFAGQVTHERRKQMVNELQPLLDNQVVDGVIFQTDGFTKGMPAEFYYQGMASAKVALCPSGPETPDTFRLYEALEAGCIPLVDSYSPKIYDDNYWSWFFDEEPPFPVYRAYEQIRGYTLDAIGKYPALNNKIFAWWQAKKRQMAYDLMADINELSFPSIDISRPDNPARYITVIMPTSPIAAHPDTSMIEQTISDVRTHLPHAEILITIDGIRPEQEHYRQRYERYKQKLLWLCNNEWHNVLPIVYEQHMHQAEMTRDVLNYVNTLTVLYVEHDTPLTPDRPIDWVALANNIADGTANMIRFSHESKILPDHKHLMIGDVERHNGVNMLKTQQWSQRPHLASTAFYKSMIEFNFNPDSRTMIEDVMHQVVEIDMNRGGQQAWYNWRIWIYMPDDPDGSILRSYNLDGRGDDPKYDMQIVEVQR